jgi:hypothetical protein
VGHGFSAGKKNSVMQQRSRGQIVLNRKISHVTQKLTVLLKPRETEFMLLQLVLVRDWVHHPEIHLDG